MLVAEDNPVNQLVIQGMLDKRGYACDVVANGREALAQLERGEHAAVLMDVQMPEMDGFEATARIRARETGGERLPIIAMTASAMEGDRERCLAAGMDDYLAKPLRPDQLDAVLERWLGAGAGSAGRAAANGDRNGLIDAGRVRRFRDDYPEIADRLVALFADTTPPLLEQLTNAVHASDDEAVRRLAHKLKGSCQNVGATRMATLCRAARGARARARPRSPTRSRRAYPADAGRDPRRARRLAASVLAAQAVPAVELEALGRELRGALIGQPGQHHVQRLVLGEPGVERVLPAEARGDLQRLAAVLAQRLEGADQEVLVRDRRADLHRRVPRGQHRQVVLVEVGDGLGVVRRELLLRDLVDPRTHQLAQQLAARLAPDRLRDHADGVLRLDETQWHGAWHATRT